MIELDPSTQTAGYGASSYGIRTPEARPDTQVADFILNVGEKAMQEQAGSREIWRIT